eukprot:CAMPEP_0206613484 /NCGR_PEP_ID=MMETSP0325_2-20121206/56735_1 /ASSEMBLY_ACC=CAM_ASM_000347 /TAXON_ID=2866 /ORGANISM="Crypthecodinium cohnii, Strain Seligo" /LENGTH=54 /DNA_ID=CAMNT_0054133621 /DNA_START=94 /DNA_END=255 /DNA_ORIENTATION=+
MSADLPSQPSQPSQPLSLQLPQLPQPSSTGTSAALNGDDSMLTSRLLLDQQLLN